MRTGPNREFTDTVPPERQPIVPLVVVSAPSRSQSPPFLAVFRGNIDSPRPSLQVSCFLLLITGWRSYIDGGYFDPQFGRCRAKGLKSTSADGLSIGRAPLWGINQDSTVGALG